MSRTSAQERCAAELWKDGAMTRQKEKKF